MQTDFWIEYKNYLWFNFDSYNDIFSKILIINVLVFKVKHNMRIFSISFCAKIVLEGDIGTTEWRFGNIAWN